LDKKPSHANRVFEGKESRPENSGLVKKGGENAAGKKATAVTQMGGIWNG